ncbi:MAG: PAS domain S-box protein [Salinirussus sp.]
MFPFGTGPLRLGVSGDGALAEALPGWSGRGETGTGPRLTVAGVEGGEGIDSSSLDGLVIDAAGTERPIEDAIPGADDGVPAVVLVADPSGSVALDALSAGAVATLPRSLLEEPALLGERVASAIESEHARQGLRQLYDGVAGTVTLHDPETGEMVHANSTLSEILGYDRDELLGMSIGEFTADVAGYDHEYATTIITSVPDRADPIEIEWPLETADGSVRWVESRLDTVIIGGREVVMSSSVDVTERRRREREYERVFDNVNDVISIHDPWAEEMLDVNETMTELTGYGRETLLEMDVGGVSAGSEGEEYSGDPAYDIQQRVAATGEPETVEWTVETADGERRRLETNLAPADIAGEDRVLALSRDVTERTRLERTYRELFENVADGLLLHDPETGEIIDANERYCEMNGYDREELIGEHVDMVSATGEEYSAEAAEEMVRRARTEGPQLFEWRNRRKNGEEFPVEVHLQFVRIRGDERVLASVREITGRKRRERSLERERDRRSMLFENNPDPIIEVEFLDGRPEITDTNQAFEDVFGFDADTIGGQTVAEALVPEDQREEYEALLERTSRGEPVETEVSRETEAGVREFLLRVIPFDAGGDEQRAYVWYTDVTERKRRERRLAEERERYSTLVEQGSDGVAVVRDGEYVFVNERLAEITGYDREELVGRPVEAPFTPEYRDVVRERHQRRVSGETPPSQYDVGIETVDGEELTVELAVSRITHEGEPAVMANFRDVTDRKRRERAVRALEDATRRMQDARTVEEVAQRAVEAAREVLDLPLAICWFHDAEAERLEPAAGTEPVHEADLVSGLSADRYEYEAFREGTVTEYAPSDVNEENPLRTALLLPLGEHGLLAAGQRVDTTYDEVVLEVARTLAEHTETALSRVKSAREVERSERRLRLIAEHIDEAIYLATPDFSTVEYANPAYEDIWGRPVGELYEDARSFVDGIDARDRSSFEADFEAMLEDVAAGDPDDSYEFEFRVRRPDDSVRWVNATGNPVELADGTRRFVGVAEDVTERKRREREYEQIFDAVHDSIVIQDPETAEPIDANRTFLDRLGYENVEAVRRAGLEGLSATDAGYTKERAQELCQRVVETGEAETVEWQQETRDGDRRWIEATVDSAVIGGEERILSIQRDVTERRRRERRLRTISERIEEIIYLANADLTEVRYVNEAYADIYGRPAQELQDDPRAFLDAVHPDDRDEYEADLRAMLADIEAGDPDDRYEFEFRIERPDGEVRWLDATGYPVLDETGESDQFVGIVKDVTERKRREREYERIFDGVQDAIAVHDPETAEVVDVNATYLDRFGYDLETVREQGVDGISATGEGFTRRRAREIFDRVVESGEPETVEWRAETADGERVWLESKVSPAVIRGEQRVLAMNRDVTERKRREREVRESERRLEAILDRIDEAVFFAPATELADGSPALDYVSSGYEEIWGRTVEEIQRHNPEGFFDTLHPDDRPEYRSFVERIVEEVEAGRTADSYSREYRIERPDGEVRWVEGTYYPVEWADGPPRMVVLSRDVTERKRRERRIASFDEATDDLATADTPGEATVEAVDAATGALELPAVGVYLYDGDEGLLRPEALRGPIPDAADRPVGPNDGPLWEAFATGTIVAPDGGTDRESGSTVSEAEAATALDDLEAWRGIALGNHGILLVGVPEGSLDPDTLQSAHVLGATLEAALNHLAGQERLADREERLRTQTERADRLDRIARLTRQVEAAITDASEPGEVERAVCERLASSGPYEAAWIGGVEVGADRLTARAVVGASGRYVENLDLTTEAAGSGTDPHPAVRAWQTDEVQVTASTVADGPAGAWRRVALERGHQSLCAVPLTYDGITHGVLTVAADSPSAFDDRVRDVLDQLGTSVGYALAAIERRRALESDETIELEFGGEDVDLPFARAARRADCRVTHQRTVARDDGLVGVYFSLEDGTDAAAAASQELPGEVEVVTDGPDSTLVEVRTDVWFGSLLAEYGAVLRGATAGDGRTSLTVEVPEQADVRSFVERLRELAPSLELVAKRQHGSGGGTPAELADRIADELTDRQFEVLRTALSAGYFEWPRESDGNDVAERLGITQPTLNKHLRIAERKTFELLFGPGTGADAEA